MKVNLFVICSFTCMALLSAASAYADDATITLDVNFSGGAGTAGTWQLSGRVDTTAGSADGQFGLSAVRAMLDGIDFGTNGDAVTFASGIGAIDPLLDQFGNVLRPPVLQQLNGTIDLVYGQDLSESETFPGSGVLNSVVPLVGTSGDVQLASGTFSAGSTPAFGQDNGGLFSQALFLTSSSGPFGAIDADNTFTIVNLITPSIEGDFNDNGVVDAADYTVWRDNEGSATALPNDNGLGTPIGASHYNLWVTNFGNGASLANGAAVPEPSAMALMLVMTGLTTCYRKR